MKRNIVRPVVLAGILCLCMPLYSIGDEKQKVIEHEYTVGTNSTLHISNKFGDVDIKDWSENRIMVKVTITVEARNEERADEILNFVNISHSESGNNIYFETNIDERIESSGFGWFGGSGNHELEIDYEISAPAYISLDLNNKYGDVFINQVDGFANIDVKYGNLLINKLSRGDNKPLNQITLGYSNGEIENVNWAKIDMKYSKLEITQGKALIMLSKYSKLFLDRSSSLVAESKYDTYEIGDISNFVTTAAYSNYKFDKLSGKFHIESRYTNAKVNYVSTGFEEIFVESKYGGFRFGIDNNATYQINGEAEYSKIYYPETRADVNRIVDNNEMSVSGIIGPGKSTTSKVMIETKYGNVHLME